MECLECKRQVEQLDEKHLAQCCGLTLQEYALRHGLSLDVLIPPDLLDVPDTAHSYPHPDNPSDTHALAVLAALQCAGRVSMDGPFEVIPGEVRTLDTLLWLGEQIEPLGFRFRQEYYSANRGSDRVVACNSLKRPRRELVDTKGFRDLSETDQRWFAAVLVAVCSIRRAAYLSLHVSAGTDMSDFCDWCSGIGVDFVELEPIGERRWLRTQTPEDAPKLLDLLQPQLEKIPHQEERLIEEGPVAMIVKEMDIDAAHFITDHSGSCANLHGGRYTVRFKVFDSIDPCTGFVIDYGDLKDVVCARVVDVLDHRTLNYAVPELAWRSSTELLAIWMWEQLIDYLPNLMELEIHETRTSRCLYRGPTLEEHLELGSSELLHHFDSEMLGRNRKNSGRRPHLRVVGDD